MFNNHIKTTCSTKNEALSEFPKIFEWQFWEIKSVLCRIDSRKDKYMFQTTYKFKILFFLVAYIYIGEAYIHSERKNGYVIGARGMQSEYFFFILPTLWTQWTQKSIMNAWQGLTHRKNWIFFFSTRGLGKKNSKKTYFLFRKCMPALLSTHTHNGSFKMRKRKETTYEWQTLSTVAQGLTQEVSTPKKGYLRVGHGRLVNPKLKTCRVLIWSSRLKMEKVPCCSLT